jgi:alkylated DNA repair protein alkB family protein 8
LLSAQYQRRDADLDSQMRNHPILSRASPTLRDFLIALRTKRVNELLQHKIFEKASRNFLIEFAKAIATKSLFGPYSHEDFLSDSDFIDFSLLAAPSTPFKGFEYLENVLSLAEEEALVSLIDSSKWDVDTDGRRVQVYGYNYLRPATEKVPLPDLFQSLLENLRYHRQLISEADSFDQLIVTEYLPGQGFRPHIDRLFWGPLILGVSLLTECTFQLTNSTEEMVNEQTLLPGSAYLLSGDARYQHLHAIEPSSVNARRVSLTFRTMASAKVAPPPLPFSSFM